ncbi:unnamed protein product [Ixodes pacificus]
MTQVRPHCDKEDCFVPDKRARHGRPVVKRRRAHAAQRTHQFRLVDEGTGSAIVPHQGTADGCAARLRISVMDAPFVPGQARETAGTHSCSFSPDHTISREVHAT